MENDDFLLKKSLICPWQDVLEVRSILLDVVKVRFNDVKTEDFPLVFR